jgi:hypothetical protein
LAGESSADNIDSGQVMSLGAGWCESLKIARLARPASLPAALSDIFESFCMGKMLCQHLSAIFVNLNLPNRLKACPLEAQVKTANSREERTHR